ncbi:MAG: sulfotransferase [Planctomycetota bacterium]
MLLHVGYHKTGTTWLQQTVFAEHDGESPFMRPWKNMVIDELVTPHPLHFDADAVRERFHAGLVQARQAGKVPLISAERLSGNPHSGGYDAGDIAHRLAAVFPQARVLMVIREQTRAILSGYRQYVMVGGACSLPKYLTPPNAGRARVPWFRFEHFEYDRLLGVYQKFFGAENVLVLTHEELCRDPDVFVSRIINHVGIEPPKNHHVDRTRRNASVSDFVLNLKRPVNRIFVRDGVNPGGLIDSQRFSRRLQRLTRIIDSFVPQGVRNSGDQRARNIVREAVGERYRQSNRRLAEMINRDLAAEGYMM